MVLFEISSFGVEIILNFQYKFSALEKTVILDWFLKLVGNAALHKCAVHSVALKSTYFLYFK